MTDTLKLHEITPFLINYATRRFKDQSINSLRNIYTDNRRWFDRTSVILKLTRMPSISALELTLKFLPVVGDIEESAQLVYDFLAKLVNTSKIFLVLKQEEKEVSKPENSLLPLPDLPNGARAVKRYIELEFA